MNAPQRFDVVSAIMDYESGDLKEAEIIELFQHLVDTGMAWTPNPDGTIEHRPLDIERGLRMMLTCHHWEPNERAAGLDTWGPSSCDAFVQYAAFGKLVYS